MPKQMTKAEARKRHRELLEEIEQQDPRTTSAGVKLRQLDQLFQIAQVLDLRTSTEEETQAVRERWLRLKTIFSEKELRQ